MSRLENDADGIPNTPSAEQDSGKPVSRLAFRLLVALVLTVVVASIVIVSYRNAGQGPEETYGDVRWSATRYTAEKQKALGLLLPISHTIENKDDLGLALYFVASARVSTNRDIALQIAQTIQDPYFRALTLGDIASAQERSDQQGADALSQQSIQSAQLIQGPERKASALCRIASLMGKTHKETAAPVFQQSIVVARAISNPEVQVEKLVWIAGAWSRVDPERAIALVPTLPLNQGELACVDILQEWANQDPLHAAQFARKAKSPFVRQISLRNIVWVWSKTDLPDAIRFAQEIDDQTQQDQALGGIAEYTAATKYDEALNIARQIRHPEYQVRVRIQIAAALRHNKPAIAASTLQQALVLARKSHDPYAMNECGMELAKTDPKSADGVFTEAAQFQVSQKDQAASDPFVSNDHGLVDIAAAQAEIDPERASRIIDLMHDSAFIMPTKRMIAVQWARTNPEKAINLATSIETQDQQDGTLCEIAALLAKTDPQQACALLPQIKDNRIQSQARIEVAAGWALTDPQQAAHFANTIADPNTKAKALVKVAAAWATKSYAQAVHFAATLEEATTQTAALAAIAATQEQTDPQHADAAYVWAVEAAQGIEDETARDHALLEIAEGWAHIVPVSAVRTVQMIRHDRAKAEAIKRIVSHWVDVVPPYPFL